MQPLLGLTTKELEAVAQTLIEGAKPFALKVGRPGTYIMRAYAGNAWFTRRIAIL